MPQTNLRRQLNKLERSIVRDAVSEDNCHYMWETFGDLVHTHGLSQKTRALLALMLLQYLGTRATARTAEKLREWAKLDTTTCTYEEYVHDTTQERGLQTDIMRFGNDPLVALICRGLWSMPAEARVAVIERAFAKNFVSADFAEVMSAYRDRVEAGLRFRKRECLCYVRLLLLYLGMREAIYALVPDREAKLNEAG